MRRINGLNNVQKPHNPPERIRLLTFHSEIPCGSKHCGSKLRFTQTNGPSGACRLLASFVYLGVNKKAKPECLQYVKNKTLLPVKKSQP